MTVFIMITPEIDDIYEVPTELILYYFGENSSFELLSKKYLIDPYCVFQC